MLGFKYLLSYGSSLVAWNWSLLQYPTYLKSPIRHTTRMPNQSLLWQGVQEERFPIHLPLFQSLIHWQWHWEKQKILLHHLLLHKISHQPTICSGSGQTWQLYRNPWSNPGKTGLASVSPLLFDNHHQMFHYHSGGSIWAATAAALSGEPRWGYANKTGEMQWRKVSNKGR